MNTQKTITTLNSIIDTTGPNRIENREILVDSIIAELDNLKTNLVASKGTIANNNTLNLGSETLLPQSVNITNSFNVLTNLITIYRTTDFTKENIQSVANAFLGLQKVIGNAVKESIPENPSNMLGGGKKQYKSRKQRKA